MSWQHLYQPCVAGKVSSISRFLVFGVPTFSDDKQAEDLHSSGYEGPMHAAETFPATHFRQLTKQQLLAKFGHTLRESTPFQPHRADAGAARTCPGRSHLGYQTKGCYY